MLLKSVRSAASVFQMSERRDRMNATHRVIVHRLTDSRFLM